MIHRDSLVATKVSSAPNIVLRIVAAVVNYIKTRPLKPRHFSALYEDMDAENNTIYTTLYLEQYKNHFN